MPDPLLRIRRRAWQDLQVACVSAKSRELVGVVVGRFLPLGWEARRFLSYTEYVKRSDKSAEVHRWHTDLLVDAANEVCARSGESVFGCWHSHPWDDEIECLIHQPLSDTDRAQGFSGGVSCVVSVYPPRARRETTEFTLVGDSCGKRCVLEAWTGRKKKVVPVRMELCGRWK